MRKKYIYLAIMAVFLGFYASSIIADEDVRFSVEKVVIRTAQGNLPFDTELALEPRQQEHGLMFRKEISENKAMLFVFDNQQIINMWMKNTLIPLDMLFIDSKGKVVYIEHDAKPESLDNIDAGGMSVKAVMEIQGGLAKKKNILVGSEIIYKAFKQ